MSPQEIQKLLGGYATGTLTSEEQQALFEAALNDQELFDALAQEQSLRDLLRDPAAKAQLLAALDERPAQWYQRFGWRPAAAVLAMASVAAIAVVAMRYGRAPQPVMVARMERAAPPVPVPSAPEAEPAKPPASQPAESRRRDALADQVNRPAAADPFKAKKASERGEAEADLRAAAPQLAKEVVPTPSAAATPAPPSPADAAGVIGGVPAGMAGGRGGSAPPPPPARETVAVEASAAAMDALAIANARSLFYGTPARQNFVSGPQALQEQQPAPLQQQAQKQGMQGRQSQAASQVAAQKMQSPLPVQQLGVKYRLMRKNPAGEFVEADPESLKTGDTIRVEFTANDRGILSVDAGGRTLFTRQVDRLTTFTTDPLKENERELTVRFTRTGVVTVTGNAAFDRSKDDASPTIQPVAAERATYVVSPPASRIVRFTISLKYK